MSVSETGSKIATSSAIANIPFFTIFLCIKWYGVTLAGWSYWWCLWPSMPTVWLVLSKLGWLH